MIEAYHGSGKGIAYTKDGKLIAFHYGYNSLAMRLKIALLLK